MIHRFRVKPYLPGSFPLLVAHAPACPAPPPAASPPPNCRSPRASWLRCWGLLGFHGPRGQLPPVAGGRAAEGRLCSCAVAGPSLALRSLPISSPDSRSLPSEVTFVSSVLVCQGRLALQTVPLQGQSRGDLGAKPLWWAAVRPSDTPLRLCCAHTCPTS